MTVHILPPCAVRDGETAEDAFRRLAREKPPAFWPDGSPKEVARCRYCGEDHRGPIELWPDEERRHHLAALYPWKEGDRVTCNGYPGTVARVCTGSLAGMAEVRVPGGLVCVDVAELLPPA